MVDKRGDTANIKGRHQVDQLGPVMGPPVEGDWGIIEDHNPGLDRHDKLCLGLGSTLLEFLVAIRSKYILIEAFELPKAGLVLCNQSAQINLDGFRLHEFLKPEHGHGATPFHCLPLSLMLLHKDKQGMDDFEV